MFGPWWYGGRGWGWGARLGFCPWTGLPRGWRWYSAPYYGTWPYYNNYYPYAYNYASMPYGWPYYSGYYPYGTGWSSQTYPSFGTASTTRMAGEAPSSREALENEYRYLQERIEEVKKRLEELKK
ncbi:MAG: hypothetical protein ACP5F1_06265 [Thermoplasmata archaeon]